MRGPRRQKGLRKIRADSAGVDSASFARYVKLQNRRYVLGVKYNTTGVAVRESGLFQRRLARSTPSTVEESRKNVSEFQHFLVPPRYIMLRGERAR